jgi:putative mRNA 3-end processing factor
MMTPHVDVTAKGAVLLGDEVVCDGFVYEMPYRVQTHIHDDHMRDFDSSKGYQRILMTEPTRQLLINELNADLKYRSNLCSIPPGTTQHLGNVQLEVLPNEHMLGCVQVAVTLANGMRVGYSGDFQWPLNGVIEVDALVVDSTYGSPGSIRRYSQEEAEQRFVELILTWLPYGHVMVKAHRGTLHRALELLDGTMTWPMLGTTRLCKEAQVYRSFGYSIPDLVPVETDEGKEIMKEDKYVRFIGKGDHPPADPWLGTTITLSAYMVPSDDPVLQYSERAYRVALSNHADFNGTLEYVKATRAHYVVTDNSRGGHGVELANAIRTELGVDARPSSQQVSRSWGI